MLLPLLLLALCGTALSACSDDDDDDKEGSTAQEGTAEEEVTPTDSHYSETPKGAATKTAVEIVKEMYAGINIGNTLESPNAAGAKSGDYSPWSGVKVNYNYVKGLQNLGFNTVRIPCALNTHLSKNDPKNLSYTIDPKWLAQVEQVVNWVTGLGMYAVLNIHWDDGWLEDQIQNRGFKDGEAIKAKMTQYWTQIATKFKDYDHHLLFAGMNEPALKQNDYSHVSDATIKDIVAAQQCFVDVVRGTGGNNAKRVLVSQLPATRVSDGLNDVYQMPKDPAGEGYQMVEFHCYDPYDFCQKDDGFLYWGQNNHVAGSKRNPTWGEEDHIKDIFAKMKKKFVDNGFPGIIGECSSQILPKNGTDDAVGVPFDEAKHKASRADWNTCVFKEGKNAGFCPCYWETSDEENRVDGTWKADYQYSLDGIMKGAKEGAYPF